MSSYVRIDDNAGSGSGGGSGTPPTRSYDEITSAISVTTTEVDKDSGISITVDVSDTSEVILGSFVGTALWLTGTDSLVNAFIYYQVDSETQVQICHNQVGDPIGTASGNETGYNPIAALNASFAITGLSAGSHTIKIRIGASGGTRSWQLNASAGGPASLTLLQFA